MRPTQSLWRHALQLTFFTRPNCSLCVDAKAVLSNVWDRRRFEYAEIDVMARGQSKWKDLYEFDTPVVHINNTHDAETTTQARKLMHRLTEAEVETAMDEVAKTK
ncbi:hypothetical protein LTR08_006901 [Meristemomyces frigidus]|nr:hypothetical protein LTR08_006901 [Meristemomyces frigidus]